MKRVLWKNSSVLLTHSVRASQNPLRFLARKNHSCCRVFRWPQHWKQRSCYPQYLNNLDILKVLCSRSVWIFVHPLLSLLTVFWSFPVTWSLFFELSRPSLTPAAEEGSQMTTLSLGSACSPILLLVEQEREAVFLRVFIHNIALLTCKIFLWAL